jgi:hypothetical protein
MVNIIVEGIRSGQSAAQLAAESGLSVSDVEAVYGSALVRLYLDSIKDEDTEE